MDISQSFSFLASVWKPLPEDSVVGVSWEGEVRGQPALLTKWLLYNEEMLTPSFSDWLLRVGDNTRYTTEGRGSIFWLPASRKISTFKKKGSSEFVRGGLNDLDRVACLWADFDTEKLGLDSQVVFHRLMNLPVPPSIVYWTGGGLQCVHLLEEAVDVSDYQKARDFSNYNKQFYKAILGDLSGIDDKVYNADRMMRLQGSRNRKPHRNGVLVNNLYFSDKRISYQTVVSVAGDIPKPQRVYAVDFKPINSVFVVDSSTYLHLVEGVKPQLGERHNVLRQVMLGCASAGITKRYADMALTKVVSSWDGESLLGVEFDNLIDWAYSRDGYYPQPATFPIVWDSELSCFRPSSDAVIRLDSIDERYENQDFMRIIPLETADRSDIVPLDELRAEQLAVLRDYLFDESSNAPHYLLLQTPPATGKTRALVKVAEEYARYVLETGDDKGRVAFFQMFTQENYQEWLEQNGGDPSLWYYFVGRNADPLSRGYCAYADTAQVIASRGYSVNQKVCTRCPLMDHCKDKWYLSQMKQAERSPIVIFRHQHGFINDFVKQRRLVIFDESLLNVYGQIVRVGLSDFESQQLPVYLENQYSGELSVIRTLERAFRLVLAENTDNQLRYGGRVVFDSLLRFLPKGLADIEAFLNLSETVVQAVQDSHLNTLGVAEAAKMPLRYMSLLKDVLEKEYPFFVRGFSIWNSRLALDRSSLIVYPMKPMVFNPKTKVIVADATATPSLYEGIFQTAKKKQAFLPILFKRDLPRRGTVIQFAGTEYSRSTLFVKKEKDANDEEVTVSSAGVEGLKHRLSMLAERHPNDLLVVTYKSFVRTLRKWVVENSIPIDPDLIVYFGNLRGTNKYQNVSAAAVIGRQRYPDQVMVSLALALSYEEMPLSVARRERIEPYKDYKVGDEGRGYSYLGWADDFLNEVFLSSIQAETIQAAHRIRINSAEQERYLYLLGAFPTVSPSFILSNSAFERDMRALDIFMEFMQKGLPLDRATFLSEMKQSGFLEATSSRAWRKFVPLLEEKAASVVLNYTKSDSVREWLADNPHSVLTNTEIAAILNVSRSLVSRIRKNVEKGKP